MILSTAFAQLSAQLAALYTEREARNIATIIFEEHYGESRPDTATRILSNTEIIDFQQISAKLLTGQPWQYVLEVADFYGLKLRVSPATLIPRAETEELIFLIQGHYNTNKKALKVLDIGTGSGCIAIAIKHLFPDMQVSALDKSAAALAIAQENAQKNKTFVEFLSLDFLDTTQYNSLPIYDIIVSNPPYITLAEKPFMGKNVLDYEPTEALFVTNNSPLQFYTAMAVFAQTHLAETGRLYAEINPLYCKDVLECWRELGFKDCHVQKDLYGKDRMLWANK